MAKGKRGKGKRDEGMDKGGRWKNKRRGLEEKMGVEGENWDIGR